MRENVPSSGAIGTRIAFNQEDRNKDDECEHTETDEITQLYGDEED